MISQEMMRAGFVARMGKMIGAYRILIGKLEGKILGRLRCRWNSIKLYF
jgi:hypothetical protein